MKNLIYFCILLLSMQVTAQTQLGGDILGDDDLDRLGQFTTISDDGSRVAVAIPYHDSVGNFEGAVRVYDYDGTNWVQVGDDIWMANSNQSSIGGVHLSADGSRLMVGNAYFTNVAAQAGEVSIYEEVGGAWVEMGVPIEGVSWNQHFGLVTAFSKDGNVVAMSNNLSISGGNTPGEVHIYEYNGSNWVFRDTILGVNTDDQSGKAIALSSNGDRIAIGAPKNDAAGNNAGHVRVFEYDGSVYDQIGASLEGSNAFDEFGNTVAISNDGKTVAIGTAEVDPFGLVRVYKETAGTWSQVGADLNGSGIFESFGYKVSLSNDGKTLLVTNPDYRNGSNELVGAAYLYSYSGGSWSSVFTNPVTGPLSADFGFSCDLSGDATTFIIGGWIYDNERGIAQIFSSSILPANILEFEVKQNVTVNELKWSSNLEVNLDKYIVQHATDGMTWTDLDVIHGEEDKNSMHTYSYIHDNPSVGLNYYRLKMVDLDATLSYSDIKSITNQHPSNEGFSFTNPIYQTDNLILETDVPLEGVIEIYDVQGKLCFTRKVKTQDSTLTIDVHLPSSGNYLLKFKSAKRDYSKPLVVLNN